MAKTTQWLNAILDYTKKVKLSISMVFDQFSYSWTANLKLIG